MPGDPGASLPVGYRVARASALLAGARPAGSWGFSGLAGHLVELGGQGASATFSYAIRLVAEAQLAQEPVAWVTPESHCFYPPDAAANGVDLASLAVVRVPGVLDVPKAADYLVRSGAFGLVVMDLGACRVPSSQLTRLLGLARRHVTAVVCLTQKAANAPSLGAVLSLRCQVSRQRRFAGIFACELEALKDKRAAPGWRHSEVFRGPAGLR